MFRRHKKIYIAITLILLIAGGVFFYKPWAQKKIETEKVRTQDIVESLSASGTVHSEAMVDLKFLTGGKIVYLGAKKGEHVKMGQVIAVLDQRTVQKNLEDSLRDYYKQRNTFDQTQENYQNRRPNEALNDAMKRILQNNQFDLEKSVSSVELFDLAKQQTVITSPIDGIILGMDVTTTGVNVPATTAFSVADPNGLVFKIDIDEADIGKVKIGQMVKINLDAYQNEELNLPVKSVDFASHTNSTGGNVFTVEVALPENTSLRYRIGMNGDAEIITNERKNVLSIPLSSVTDDDYVYLKKGSVFEKKKIKLGLQNDTDTEVISGLSIGDEVAIDPAEAEKLVKK